MTYENPRLNISKDFIAKKLSFFNSSREEKNLLLIQSFGFWKNANTTILARMNLVISNNRVGVQFNPNSSHCVFKNVIFFYYTYEELFSPDISGALAMQGLHCKQGSTDRSVRGGPLNTNWFEILWFFSVLVWSGENEFYLLLRYKRVFRLLIPKFYYFW